jgi:hypothetical protein
MEALNKLVQPSQATIIGIDRLLLTHNKGASGSPQIVPASARPLTSQYGRDGLQQHHNVVPYRPVVYVPDVEPHTLCI